MKSIVGWVVATVVVVVVLVGVSGFGWLGQGSNGDRTDPRFQQRAGASQAGKQTAATGKSEEERFEEVSGTLRPVQLNNEQRGRLRQQLARHASARSDSFDYSLTVGASIPRQIALQDLPIEIADTLGGYHGAKFLIVRDQVVIVDEARRIVAIIPNVA
jgi:hypothetical protein